MRRARFAAALIAALAGGAPAAASAQAEASGARDGAASERTRLEARLDTLGRELAAAGFELDGAPPALVAVAPADWAAALARAGAALRALDDSPAAWLLSGVTRADDVERKRAAAAHALAEAVRLRYDATSQRLLVLETAQADAVADERVLVHELARAWLDRRFGLARLAPPAAAAAPGPTPGSAPATAPDAAPTLEQTELRAGLEEGLADAVALEVLLARGQRTLAELTPQQLEDALARLAAAPGPLARYSAGRRFASAGLRDHGRGFLERVYAAPPRSTTALLHAAKRAEAAPPAVEHVDWPADWEPLPLVVDDVVGELRLYDALLGAGVARPAAWRAAVGWHGDRIRLWANERESLWAWRIVCDREADAVQLVSAWSRSGCRVRRSGRAFSCVLGSDPQHVEALLDLLAELPLAAAEPAAAASTQAVEDAPPVLSPEARVEAESWIVPSVGLSFPSPRGWRAQTMSGTPYLFAPVRVGSFIDNLNAQSFADPSNGDIERIAADNRAGLEQIPGLALQRSEIVRLAALEQTAVWMRYSGNQGGNELEFCALLIPRAGRIVVLTASLLAEGADLVLPEIERALFGVREL